MAMFSGQTTTVTTPDGRTLVIPAEVAASLQGLPPQAGTQGLAQPGGGGLAPLGVPSIAGPGPGPAPDGSAPLPLPGGGAPSWGPADMAGLVAQTPPPDATAAPVTTPAQVPHGGPRAQPRRGPTTEPGPDQGPQQVTPDAPPTNQQLAKLGIGGALQLENQGLDKEQAATRAAADVEGQTADQQGAVLKQRDIDTAAALQERARAAAADRAKLEQRMRDRDAYAAKLANTRIDRSVDHPVWTAIGMALSTIGTAMQNQQATLSAALLGHAAPAPVQNPAIAAMFGAIDRKVDAQMKELDIKRAGLAQMNLGIGDQRQVNADRLSEIDARRDAALQQAKQSVETIVTQMKNPQAKANAELINSKIDEERGKLATTAVDRAQSQLNTEAAAKAAAIQHAQTIAVTRRGQDIGYQIHKETIEATEREKMAQISAELLTKGDKDGAAKAKDLSERGVWDPRTGDVQLTPAGQKKLENADKLEATARQQTDPALAEKQRQAAADLRTSARLNDGVLAPDKATADKIRPSLQASQEITDQIGIATKQLGADPSAFDREQWAGIATRLANIANTYQKTIGERISVKAFDQTMKHILEFDPDSMFDRAASQKRALESLRTLKGIVADGANAELKGNGIKSNWVPVAMGENDTKFNPDARTAVEAGEAAKPNLRSQITSLGLVNLEDSAGNAQSAVEGEKGGQAGLPATTVAALHGLAQRADQSSDADRARIVESLRNPIEAGLKEGPGGRPSLAYGMLDVLRNENPRLYSEVVSQLPKEQADQLRTIDEGRSKLRVALPPPTRTPSGFDPDAAAGGIDAGREGAARAVLRRGGPLRNSPGAGTPR